MVILCRLRDMVFLGGKRGNLMANLLIIIFLGPLGIHKFMQKKIGMGILYFFTFGLFGIGWIYDIVIACKNINSPKKIFNNSNLHQIPFCDILKWQRLVLDIHSDKPIASKEQLEAASQLYVENNVRILADSMRLIRETFNPEVYFKRVDLAIECLNNLADLEEFYPTGADPVMQLQNFDEIALLHDFIQRYWFKVVSDAEKLKTEKAKENRKIKAKEELYEFSEKIDSYNLEYIEQLS